jgi:hypothetical protein
VFFIVYRPDTLMLAEVRGPENTMFFDGYASDRPSSKLPASSRLPLSERMLACPWLIGSLAAIPPARFPAGLLKSHDDVTVPFLIGSRPNGTI